MYFQLFVGSCVCLCFDVRCFVFFLVLQSFLNRKRERERELLCFYCLTDAILKCHVTLPRGLQCVIVVFPDHTHILFESHSQ